MANQTQEQAPTKGAERFEEVLREKPSFAEALERVKRLQTVLEQFESPLKRADTPTEGQWKPSRLTLHSPKPA